jgi:hypothetical protein
MMTITTRTTRRLHHLRACDAGALRLDARDGRDGGDDGARMSQVSLYAPSCCSASPGGAGHCPGGSSSSQEVTALMNGMVRHWQTAGSRRTVSPAIGIRLTAAGEATAEAPAGPHR